MPSRLSSLLVRDGLIGVRRMEQAFQRQVIYGGCLDTILLEMNLVPEERLVQYLALSTGLPPATRAETETFDAEAITRCPRDMAREFRVVPLCIQDGALRVLVHDPVDLPALEEFADQLGFPVQPLVVPEYRYQVVFGRIFDQKPETRFAALARRAEDAVPVSPVGRAQSVIVENEPVEGETDDIHGDVLESSAPRERALASSDSIAPSPGAAPAAETTGEDFDDFPIDVAAPAAELDAASEPARDPAPIHDEAAAGGSNPQILGREADTGGPGLQVLDREADTGGPRPHELGRETGANGPGSHALGRETGANGPGPHELGRETGADGPGPRVPAREAGADGPGPRVPAREAGADGPGPRVPAREADADGPDLRTLDSAPDAGTADARAHQHAPNAGAADASVLQHVPDAGAADASAQQHVPDAGAADASVLQHAPDTGSPDAGAQQHAPDAGDADAHAQRHVPDAGGPRAQEPSPAADAGEHAADAPAADAPTPHATDEPNAAPPAVAPASGAATPATEGEAAPASGAATPATEGEAAQGGVPLAGAAVESGATGVPTPTPDASSGVVSAGMSGPISRRHRAPDDIDPEPLSIAEARTAFGGADSRDQVFEILLRAVRAKASYAGLLTVKGGAVMGRVALVGEYTDRHDIAEVLIALDEPSAFRTVVDTAAPHIGPIATGDPDLDERIERMGRVVPPTALLLPVVLRDRVLAIAIGHSGHDLISIAEVSELLPLASEAADALWRIILASKQQRAQSHPGVSGPNPAPAAPVELQPTGPTKPMVSAVPTPEPAAPEPVPEEPAEVAHAPATGEVTFHTEVSVEAEAPRTIEEVLDALESDDEATVEGALDEARLRVNEALPELERRFPGKLGVDRYELGGRVLGAEQHGSLLALVVRMGDAAVDLLLDKSKSDERDVRYYATLCLSEMRPRRALNALVERLFDTDYGTRTAATTGLAGYPVRDLDQGLVRARQALHSEDDDRVKAAARALAELSDIQAIPDLIDVQAAGGVAVDHARRALVRLTKQNYGSSTRKWRSWWNKNQDRTRVEWLLDGLAHKDESIRRSSVEELRKLTSEYFEYHYDLPKREREPARKRWLQWWSGAGRKRFLRTDEARS